MAWKVKECEGGKLAGALHTAERRRRFDVAFELMVCGCVRAVDVSLPVCSCNGVVGGGSGGGGGQSGVSSI